MQNDRKFIMGLLIVILVLGIIMALKMTKIIKPAEKDLNTIEVSKDDELINVDDDYSFSDVKRKTSLIGFIMKNIAILSIITNIAAIIINIGIGKLYNKLMMPNWTVIFQMAYPFITLFTGILFNKIQSLVSLITSILSLVILIYYFRSLDMKWFWPILPIASIVMTSFSSSMSFSNALMLSAGTSSSGGGARFLLILGIAMMIAYIGAYIVSNIRLAKRFDKGIGFTIGLVILPFIFQPILGYSEKELRYRRNQ